VYTNGVIHPIHLEELGVLEIFLPDTMFIPEDEVEVF
jgi:hypothetical protein